jgi:hypothetical protein
LFHPALALIDRKLEKRLHRPPPVARPVRCASTFHGRNVVMFGADVTRQALDAGLVDEILVHVAPVLLGDGVRLPERRGSERTRLQPIDLGSTGHLADLHYRVVK